MEHKDEEEEKQCISTHPTNIFLEKVIPTNPQSTAPKDHLYIFQITSPDITWQVTKKLQDIIAVCHPLGNVKTQSAEEFGKKVASRIQGRLCTHTSKALLEFCEVSELTPNVAFPKKFKEGLLRRYPNCHVCSFMRFLQKAFRRWERMWVIVTHDFIALLRSSESKLIHEIILFDPWFRVTSSPKATGLSKAYSSKTPHVRLCSRPSPA